MFPETPSETVNLHSEREKLKTLFGGPQVTWWRLFGGVQRKSMRNPSGAAEEPSLVKNEADPTTPLVLPLVLLVQ